MRKFKSVSIVIFTITIIAMLFTGCGEERKAAIAAYDNECSRIATEQSELEKTISDSQALIDSKEKPYDETTITALETSIADARAAIVEIPERKGNTENINNLVNDTLKKISYTKNNEELVEAKSNFEISIKVMKQVTNPSEAFIIERIKDIKGVKGYAGVTEDNDPNGNLNKPGGYTSTVYFAYDKVKADWLDGTIIENGTSGGGGIEVYVTEDDAKKREEYLASFDGSVWASGSHVVIGTILVRTSDELTASQQKELEKQIVDNLLELRD